MTTANACIWVRVSTGSQDESTQLRELKRFAEANGYRVVKAIRLHDVSASKGEQETAMGEVVEDIKAGRYTVLLVDDSSRLDRRDNVHARDYFRAAVGLAGGAIVSRTEPLFGKVDLAGQVTTLLAAQGNADYSKKLKEQVDRAIRLLAANRGFMGKRPWGWTTAGPRYGKKLVCEKPGEIAEMYRLAAEGQSAADIGRAFGLYPETVDSIVRNAVNAGRRLCSHTFADGSRIEWVHETEPVVDEETWRLANAQLDLKKTKPSASGRKPKHLLSGAVACGECGGVMHSKIQTRKSGKTYAYLRCAGPRKTANPNGCGNSHGLGEAMAAVEDFMRQAGYTAMERKVKPGNRLELAAERRKLDESRASLSSLPEAVKAAALAALEAEYEKLNAVPVIEDEEVLAPLGALPDLWRDGSRRRWLLESLDLVMDREGRVHLSEDFPGVAGDVLVLQTGLILDLRP